MQDLTGKWKVSEMLIYSPETKETEWVRSDDALFREDIDDHTMDMFFGELIFEEDGNMRFLVPLPLDKPQEEIDQAVASGEMKVMDDMMVLEDFGKAEDLQELDNGMIELDGRIRFTREEEYEDVFEDEHEVYDENTKDIIGKWRIAELCVFNDRKMKTEWLKKEEIMSSDDLDPQYKMMAGLEMIFGDDGSAISVYDIPEGTTQEQVDEAVASGEIQLLDGKIIESEYRWYTEDGVPYYDSRHISELTGEMANEVEEIKRLDNGMIEVDAGRYFREE